MANSFVQRSFAGGEIAPALYARADQAKYQSGLVKCENFIVMRHGGVYNRPGFQYIATASSNVNAANSNQRLWKFVYNAEHTYLLLFSHLQVVFYRYGFPLVTNASTQIVVTTPYTSAQLAGLQFVQSGNELTIVHRSHPPKVLKRTVTGTPAFTTFTLSDQLTQPALTPVTGVTSSRAATTAQINSGDYVRYLVTAAALDSYEESYKDDASTAFSQKPSGTTSNTISWTAKTGVAEYYIYKSDGKQESFGYIGVSGASSTPTFVDNNISPDYEDTPPLPVTMFSPGNYPGCVGFYQQRQIYASTDATIEKVWMSRSGSTKNFTRSSPFKDDDAVTFTIQGREVSEIRHVIEVGTLVILTSSGEWIAAGDSDGAIRPQAINLRQQGYVGAADIQPIVIANNILYVQARRNSVRDFRYDLQVDGYTGRDLTVFSAHLFDGYQIINWTFQQIPHSVVWAVRDDGALLGLTYVKEHEIAAWHKHFTDGIFEDVVCLPENDYDSVYALIRREINGASVRFLERMYNRPSGEFVNIKTNCIFLDASSTYNGSNLTGAPYGATSTRTISITYDRTGVYDIMDDQILTSSAPLFVASDVGNAFEVYDEYWGATISYKVIALNSSTSVSCTASFSREFPPQDPSGPQGGPPPPTPITTTNWYRAVDELSGLNHLAGRAVSVLADGNVESDLLVSVAGKIQLQRPAVTIHVGLPYTSRIKTLPIDLVNQETLSDKRKTINRVSMFVESSRGIWVCGDAKNFVEYKQRATENWGDEIYSKTGIIEVQTSSAWDKQGQVIVEQRDPLPLSILSIVPRITTSPQ